MIMNISNLAIATTESHKESSKQSYTAKYRFDFDAEFNPKLNAEPDVEFDINLLKNNSPFEAEISDCYVLGYN